MTTQYQNVQTNGGGAYVPPDYDPPPPSSSAGGGTGGGTWASIDNIVGGVTPWKVTNFAAKAAGITDFGGSYPVISVTNHQIVLGDPGTNNAAWAALGTDETIYFSPTLSTDGMRWVGPFVVDLDDCDHIIANFVCPQGLYRQNREGEPGQLAVTGLLEVQPINPDGTYRDDPSSFACTLVNTPEKVGTWKDSDATIDKGPRGKTLSVDLQGSAIGLVQVRFRRTNPLPNIPTETFVDELIIRDCYGVGPIAEPHFGDVTTVHTRIQATSQSTATKERKLQAVVTRKLPKRNLDNTFGPVLLPTRNAADIICGMALDPHIGGRSLAELDVDQIYDTVAAVQAYFGFTEAGYFDYTFDDDNSSFEEMVQIVCQAIFCNAYRQGSILRLFFEREIEDSTLLFNHRNKIPGSETRTVRFGTIDDHDGVEFDYRTYEGVTKTIFIPADQTALKPKKIERAGVTDDRVAQLHAWRIWNRMRYQNTTVELEATAEASQLVLNERVEIADNTRPDVFDGYLVSQNGMTLELSQPFTPAAGIDYNIFIQLPTGGLDVLPIVAGADEMHCVLQAPPTVALDFDPTRWADITYQIVGNTDARSSAFLITEKGAFDKRSCKVQAINYDPRYYANDHDFGGA
jgi:hypothetical protein